MLLTGQYKGFIAFGAVFLHWLGTSPATLSSSSEHLKSTEKCCFGPLVQEEQEEESLSPMKMKKVQNPSPFEVGQRPLLVGWEGILRSWIDCYLVPVQGVLLGSSRLEFG